MCRWTQYLLLTIVCVLAAFASGLAAANQAVAQEAPAVTIDGRIEARLLQVQSGQTIRPQGQGRATIVVSAEDFTLADDQLRFERIDFTTNLPPRLATAGTQSPPALMRLLGNQVVFSDCTFQGDGRQRVAVQWQPQENASPNQARQLTFDKCVFRQVAGGVATTAQGLMTLEFVDALHVGFGPLVELATLPTVGNTLAVTLEHTTVRQAQALLVARHDHGDDRLGRLAIHAVDSVLVTLPANGLVQVCTRAEPPEWLTQIAWTGQGTIVVDETPMMQWCDPQGHKRVVAENVLRASGVVRGRVRFEGEDLHAPFASYLRQWSAPLRSLDPPGISDRHRPTNPNILPASVNE